ncbi:MAG: cation:proton antiporter, partial [Bacteroidales bacterium]|nr:cation:proton antiporter [Bacteroidales bacterium]
MADHYILLANLGLATLIMAWLPSISKKIRVSSPVMLLLIGILLYMVGTPLGWSEFLWSDKAMMVFSEAIVIISLMGAGLKIGSDYSFKAWKRPLLLIVFTMPLTMLAAYLFGVYFLALSIPASLLLAAALAPTDPVLASDVQLDDPQREDNLKDKLRFSLTAEAGLNDGMAFPFTYLAVLVAQAGSFAAFNFGNWLWDKLLLKVVIGVAVGLLVGRGIGFLLIYLNKRAGIKTNDGFLALSLTFAVYGVAELLHGYGFLAVFFAGLSLRYSENVTGNYKQKMHDFSHEIERLLIVIWIIIFGSTIMNGILAMTDWKGILFSALFVVVVRPLAGLISLAGIKDTFKSKLALSFLGIRGVGSIFYLSWAFLQTNAFENKLELYSISAYIILFSVILH